MQKKITGVGKTKESWRKDRSGGRAGPPRRVVALGGAAQIVGSRESGKRRGGKERKAEPGEKRVGAETMRTEKDRTTTKITKERKKGTEIIANRTATTKNLDKCQTTDMMKRETMRIKLGEDIRSAIRRRFFFGLFVLWIIPSELRESGSVCGLS